MQVRGKREQAARRWGRLAILMVLATSTTAWAQTPSQPPAPPQAPASTSSPASGATGDSASAAPAQATAAGATPSLEIYGFGQGDVIADFKQNDPNWFDVNRPSKLPASPNQFGFDGRSSLSVRQSRFGVKAEIPTSDGPVKAQFEFDMFGVGVDAGQTTIRLRHAFGQWKHIGAGQTNSQFMDVDVFPNVLDYWGPNGMLFFRNVQVFYQIVNDSKFESTVAIERPGASGDAGVYSDRVELQNITPRFPIPDFTGHIRYKGFKWGYVQVGGVIRRIAYDDTLQDQFNLSGAVTGAGISFSSNISAIKDNVIRLQYVYGHGIENYFNDAPVDVGLKNNPGNAVTPVLGVALPATGVVIYLDHTWSSKFSSSVGYSLVNISNSDADLPSAYHQGQYASINLLCTPVKNVMMGGELQYAHRANNSDGFTSDDVRMEFSFKYSFSFKVGG